MVAYHNKDTPEGQLVTVEQIVRNFWAKYGRNYYSRHDYENVDAAKADELMAHLVSQQKDLVGKQLGSFTVATADEFEYVDSFDKSVSSHQGVRIIFTDGSRIIFRLSGTGSSGATIRVYLEQYRDDPSQFDQETQVALKELIDIALSLSKIKEFTGRDEPTVIT